MKKGIIFFINLVLLTGIMIGLSETGWALTNWRYWLIVICSVNLFPLGRLYENTRRYDVIKHLLDENNKLKNKVTYLNSEIETKMSKETWLLERNILLKKLEYAKQTLYNVGMDLYFSDKTKDEIANESHKVVCILNSDEVDW